MSRLDDLSPDQRAVLQLLLRQGKSYDELAALLRIDPAAVRSRAAGALGALGPAIDEADRDELSDWLLGQQDELETEDTLDLIDDSPAALEWAIEVGDALREGGLEPRGVLPDEIEEDEAPLSAPAPPPVTPPAARAPAEATPVAAERAAPAAPAALPGFGERSDDDEPRPSRLGGILLIAGVAAVVVILIVVLLTRGGDDSSNTSASTSTPAAQTSTAGAQTATTQEPITVEAQVNMRPTAQGGKALGVAQFFTDGTDHGVTVTAQGLPANTSKDVYALWLAGGTKDKATTLLGFSPNKVTKNGRFSGSITLPDDAGDYREIVLTRETRSSPTDPGTVILRGALGN